MREVKRLGQYQGASVSKPSAKARLIRNRQATVMLEVSLALLDVKRFLEVGGDDALVCEDIEALARYLRDSAF